MVIQYVESVSAPLCLVFILPTMKVSAAQYVTPVPTTSVYMAMVRTLLTLTIPARAAAARMVQSSVLPLYAHLCHALDQKKNPATAVPRALTAYTMRIRFWMDNSSQTQITSVRNVDARVGK